MQSAAAMCDSRFAECQQNYRYFVYNRQANLVEEKRESSRRRVAKDEGFSYSPRISRKST